MYIQELESGRHGPNFSSSW